MILLSLHVNAAGNGQQWMKARGWSCYTTRGETRADALATYLYEAAKTHLPGMRLRTDYTDGDPDQEENFYILHHTRCPPFSLFREYVAQLIKYDKKFLIIGNQNAIHYREIFPLFKNNQVWLGYGFNRNCAHFISRYTDTASDADHREGMIRVSGVTWFTNLEIQKRHEELILYKAYSPAEYPRYDNYDAINVDNTNKIPMDYIGEMGVPITFMYKYCPEQFDIIGTSTDSMPKGAPYIDGKRIYERIIIRKK